jgi:hypothetical protein
MDREDAENSDNVRPVALGRGLVIELDRQQARAVLFGSVQGQGRFIAASATPSTTLPPIDDASVAIKQAVRDIEEQTGYSLVGPNGLQIPADGDQGVHYLALTGQPVAPVRLLLLATGASPLTAPLAASARRAVAIVQALGNEVRSADGVLTGALLEQQARAFSPDAVVLLEGAAAEAEWSTAAGTLAALIADGAVGQVIIVAREHYQQLAAQVVGDQADLRGIDPDEFSAGEIASALEQELNALFEARVEAQNLVAASAPPRFVSVVRAADLVTRFLARRREQTVLSVSVGDGTSVHRATTAGGDVQLRPEFDLAHNIRSVLALEPRLVTQWLPFALSNEEFTHWVLNRALRPFVVVDAPRDAAIEAAIVTAFLRDMGQEAAQQSLDLIIGGRPFAEWRAPGLAVMALLNATQPSPTSGLLEVVLDVDGLLPAAGAIGEQSPALAADAVELDLLQPAATVVVVTGAGNEGDLAVRGQLRYAHGEAVRFSVPYGSLHRLPLPEGHEATLSLTCEPRFVIGPHASGEEFTFGEDMPLRGSELGIVIDARGRPLHVASDPSLQAARVASWLEDLGVRV